MAADETPGPNEPRRRWWFFSLKDRLPLPAKGWTVVVHQPECGALDDGLACMEGAPCFAHRARFLGIPETDRSMQVGVGDISAAIEIVNGRAPRDDLELPEGSPTHRWVIVVSVVEPPGELVPFEDAFSIVVDAVIALRNATGVSIPDPSIERVHPIYMLGIQEDGGEVVPWNTVIVDHMVPGGPPPADEEKLKQAQQFLFERWRGHPTERYRTFATKATTSARQDGNYEAAILNAAIACEFLTKTLAWMTTYEASLLDPDPSPQATRDGLGSMKPRQLIGRVLQPRLGGNWNSAREGQPVREWRVCVAQRRNELLHLAGGVTQADALRAVAAMDGFASHLMDRIALHGGTYPQTAMTLVGRSGLTRRGQLAVVERSLESIEGSEGEWLAGYLSFVAPMLGET